MHPVVQNICTKNLLEQSVKTISMHILRKSNVRTTDNVELPPEPTTCCMSGCANCVWIEYAETLTKLLDGNTDKARTILLKKISDPNLKMFLSVELKNLQFSKDNKTKQ